MIKKSILLLLFAVLLSSSVLAQVTKMEVSTTKPSFAPGETITLKVTLLDEQNNPVSDDVNIIIQDGQKITKIEAVRASNTPVDFDLGSDVSPGFWSITANYGNITSTPVIFNIETVKSIKFEIVNDTLTITNNGNARYTKTVQIAIDSTIGNKEVDLEVGEKVSFRLVAPSGTYKVQVTDGENPPKAWEGVSLTGNVIGVLDKRIPTRGPSTVGIQTGENVYGEEPAPINSSSKNWVYIFVVMIAGAAILLAIERRYKKRAAYAGY